MAVIDRATAHYVALVKEPKRIVVPEWSNEEGEVEIYSTPLTIAERKFLNSRSGGDHHDMAVELLLLKAKDEEGNAIFTKEDRAKLKNKVDSSVIQRLASEIVGGDSVESEEVLEEVEKN